MECASSPDALQRLSHQLRASLREWRHPPRRRHVHRPELVWLLCWQLKDLGWVLFCGPLAWTAGVLALGFQGHDLFQNLESATAAELTHSLATVGWLCGSFVWMTAALLFEPVIHKTRRSPWYEGALLTANAHHYDVGTTLMQVIEGTALTGVLLFYAWASFGSRCYAWLKDDSRKLWHEAPSRLSPEGHQSARRLADGEIERLNKALSSSSGAATPERSVGHPQAGSAGHPPRTAVVKIECVEGSGLVFGFLTPSVYAKTFIVPWILKDLFWSLHWFLPTVLCMLLAIGLMTDYLWLSVKWKNAAMLLWAIGSTVWICHDLVMDEQETWPLFLTVLCFAISCCILSSAILSVRVPKSTTFDDEHDPLL
mmetsp:Transcript_111953/g.209947  ORF Transcript_111953/g.209947 Transcript_111953/m.209947 type:complete len:369 (-) Transcript_111953:27-1133(-)